MLVRGPVTEARVLDRRVVALADPEEPQTIQPFHAGLDRPGALGAGAVKRLVASVRTFGSQSIGALVREWRRAGHRFKHAGIVVGSLINPAAITNEHIRAHAEEGRLFRVVVEEALAQCEVDSVLQVEKTIWERGSEALKVSLPKLKAQLKDMGRGLEGGWRADDKTAALAALISVVSHG